MILLTEEIKRLLPPLYANEDRNKADIKVPLKIFDPGGRFTFYATEYDGEDTLFGFCRSPLGEDCDELGYASLVELQSVKNTFGIGMERDINWNPETTLEQVLKGDKR